jgi:hypothetical protein
LALVAALALSGLATSVAQAASVFDIEGAASATFTGEQTLGKHVLTVDGSNVECESVVFQSVGAVFDEAGEATMHPTYSSCKALFGFVEGTFTSTGCNYRLVPWGLTSEIHFGATFSLTCETGKKLIITAGTCEATISAQSFGVGDSYSNETGASPMDLRLKLNSVTVVVSKTKDGVLCPFSGTGMTNGSYSGNTTIRAYNGGTQVGLTGK